MITVGISQGEGNGACPGQEFFVGWRVAGAGAFGDSIGAHRSPFVMVALESDFEQVVELTIVRDVSGGQVRVIVHNRLAGRVFVIQPLCCL